jgi:hypothetical protein
LTVATISSPPSETMKAGVTYRQATVAAQPGEISVGQLQQPQQKKARPK